MHEAQVWSLGWEVPGERNGNPLQYSCLGNPLARGAWRATLHGVAEPDTTERLNNNRSSLVKVSRHWGKELNMAPPWLLSQFSSVAQLCPTLCDPTNHSTPGLPVHHQLPEFTETHVHQVSDAIQPSHPLSSPSPLAPNPSQHQSLFQWVNSSREVAKVLEFQL